MPSCYLCEIPRPATTSAHQIHANIHAQIQCTGCPRLPLSAIRACPSLAERSTKSTPSSQRSLPQQPEQVRGGPQQPDRGLDEADLGRRLRHRRLHQRLRPQPPSRPQGQRLGDGRPQDSLRDSDVVPPPQHRHPDRRSEEPRAAYRRAPNQVGVLDPQPRKKSNLGGATGYLAAENQDVTRQLVRTQQHVGVKCSVLAGACNLCNGGIRFVREQRPNRSIRDMPLQIESRRELLQRSGRSPDGISSVILVEKDRSFIKSKVVLRIMEYLNLFEIHGLN
uniref:Uncharacterized protein n=1 Tax=Zea mays TaxID=4577 RepID=A0A804RKX2_MAIZE